MLSDKLLEALNEQMNFEFESAHTYMAMAAWCSDQSLDGFANFFLVQAEEERFHAMKFYNYINDRGKRATITGYDTPKNEFDSILDVYKHGYEHERMVTERIYKLSDIAMDEREHATIQFLKFFLDEQVEEEAMFDTIIDKLKLVENDKHALFMLDDEFSKRTFTPGGNE
ncbi:ferritin [Desertibacillus haloalkaliphilus]|uniref:ferritin n=1 Tax=Desertibacillus haloalkaliphilus TaxID=1328930 RepID=UPI001C26CCC6|nr:ferritin [Desertibacillus haloalkaliphilus]MBU8907948.1 ferritin [Desertibacillus haloalkaliphilus]